MNRGNASYSHKCKLFKEQFKRKMSDSIQGSYTDYYPSPYYKRDIIEAMSIEEEVIFMNYILQVMKEDKAISNLRSAISSMEDRNMVYVDAEGLMRVNPNYPGNNPSEI
jgi:hypothetical protein